MAIYWDVTAVETATYLGGRENPEHGKQYNSAVVMPPIIPQDLLSPEVDNTISAKSRIRSSDLQSVATFLVLDLDKRANIWYFTNAYY
jgi:hypothetical protein